MIRFGFLKISLWIWYEKWVTREQEGLGVRRLLQWLWQMRRHGNGCGNDEWWPVGPMMTLRRGREGHRTRQTLDVYLLAGGAAFTKILETGKGFIWEDDGYWLARGCLWDTPGEHLVDTWICGSGVQKRGLVWKKTKIQEISWNNKAASMSKEVGKGEKSKDSPVSEWVTMRTALLLMEPRIQQKGHIWRILNLLWNCTGANRATAKDYDWLWGEGGCSKHWREVF